MQCAVETVAVYLFLAVENGHAEGKLCQRQYYEIFADQQQRSQCTTSVIVNSFRGITRPQTFSTCATSFLEHTFVTENETLLYIL